MTNHPLFYSLPILIFNRTSAKPKSGNFQYYIYAEIIMTYNA